MLQTQMDWWACIYTETLGPCLYKIGPYHTHCSIEVPPLQKKNNDCFQEGASIETL